MVSLNTFLSIVSKFTNVITLLIYRVSFHSSAMKHSPTSRKSTAQSVQDGDASKPADGEAIGGQYVNRAEFIYFSYYSEPMLLLVSFSFVHEVRL